MRLYSVKREVCRRPLHQTAACPLQQPRKQPRLLSPEDVNPQDLQKAKFNPLRTIPKLFLGPSIIPKLRSLVQPMCRANRISRPAPNCVSTLVSLPKCSVCALTRKASGGPCV